MKINDRLTKPKKSNLTDTKSKDPEDIIWEYTVSINTKEGYQSYIKSYSKGQYVILARAKLILLDKNADSTALPLSRSSLVSWKAGHEFIDCDYFPEMIVLPNGDFYMGGINKNEQPIHKVNLKSFAIDKTKITQAHWKALMGSNPSNFSNCGDRCPVDSITWDDAQNFIIRLNAKTGKNIDYQPNLNGSMPAT